MQNPLLGILALKATNMFQKKEKIRTAKDKIEEIGTVPSIIEEINKPYKLKSTANINHILNLQNKNNNASKKFGSTNFLRNLKNHININNNNFIKENENSSKNDVECKSKVSNRQNESQKLLNVLKSGVIEMPENDSEKDIEVKRLLNFYVNKYINRICDYIY